MQLTQSQLFDAFSSLTNWQDRYRQIILLSKTLPTLSEQDRTEQNQIFGCENKVWLTYQKNSEHKLTFYADSEGRIVKGLLAILLTLINGKTGEEIQHIDLLDTLKTLKVIEQLSTSRQLGIQNIIHRIQQIALNS